VQTDFHRPALPPLESQACPPWLIHEHKAQFIVEAADIAEDTDIDETADWLNKAGWSDAPAATQTKRRRSAS